MKLGNRTIRSLAQMICGSSGQTGGFEKKHFPYRSSSYLTQFFRDLDLPDRHDGSTRDSWVESVLERLNDGVASNPQLPPNDILRVVQELMDAEHFKPEEERAGALDVLNEALKRDGLQAYFDAQGKAQLHRVDGGADSSANPIKAREWTHEEKRKATLLEAYLAKHEVWVYIAHSGSVVGRAKITSFECFEEVVVGPSGEVRRNRCLGILELPGGAPPNGKPKPTTEAEGPRWVWKYPRLSGGSPAIYVVGADGGGEGPLRRQRTSLIFTFRDRRGLPLKGRELAGICDSVSAKMAEHEVKELLLSDDTPMLQLQAAREQDRQGDDRVEKPVVERSFNSVELGDGADQLAPADFLFEGTPKLCEAGIPAPGHVGQGVLVEVEELRFRPDPLAPSSHVLTQPRGKRYSPQPCENGLGNEIENIVSRPIFVF